METLKTHCKDAPERFSVQGLSETKTCVWAARQATPFRCRTFPEVAEHCPKTCGLCTSKSSKSAKSENPSSLPTNSPSEIPSDVPSSAPSKLPSNEPSSVPSGK